jgi:hypothetical protein
MGPQRALARLPVVDDRRRIALAEFDLCTLSFKGW